MEILLKLLTGLENLFRTLNSSRVLLFVVLCIASIFSYFLFENRQPFFTAVINSQFFSLGLLIGVLLLTIGLTFRSLIRKVELTNDQVIMSMREQIEHLRDEVRECIVRERLCEERYNTVLNILKGKDAH